MARPTLTLVYLAAGRVVRADFGNGADLLGLWTAERPEVEDPGLLLEYTLHLGPRPGRSTWVLPYDLWTGNVRLGAASLALKGEDLERALAFEAEPLSGIGGLDSSVGFTPLRTVTGQREFRVVQARLSELEALRDVAARCGTRLAGVTHPSGMPLPLGERAFPWARVEAWNDGVLALQQQAPEQPVDALFVAGEPLTGRWRNQMQDWSAVPRPAPHFLIESSRLAPLAEEAAPCNLEETHGLEAWLRGWAEVLRSRHPSVPHLRAPARSLTGNERLAIALWLGLLVGALCFAHARFLVEPAQASALAELKELQDRQNSLKAAGKLLEAKQAERKKLLLDNDGSRLALRALEMQRERFSGLLADLAKQPSRDWFLRKIDYPGGELCLHGTCARPLLAGDVARHMAGSVSDLGWRLHEPRADALQLAPDGGP